MLAGLVDLSDLRTCWLWQIRGGTRPTVSDEDCRSGGTYLTMYYGRHYLETQHTFSMQLGRTQRVWDYIGGEGGRRGGVGLYRR